MLMAWSPTRLVVSFRGTASWTNVWADLQVLSPPPPCIAKCAERQAARLVSPPVPLAIARSRGPSRSELSTVAVLTSES